MYKFGSEENVAVTLTLMCVTFSWNKVMHEILWNRTPKNHAVTGK